MTTIDPHVWRLTGGPHTCECRIHNPEWETAEQKRRQYRARLKGRDPTECLQRASFVVHGRRMCANHAGQAALRILMGEPTHAEA